MKLKSGEDVGNHIAQMETKFSELASMNVSVGELMEVAILVSSLFGPPEYAAISASKSSMRANNASCNYVSMNFTEEQPRQKIQQSHNEFKPKEELGTLATSVSNNSK